MNIEELDKLNPDLVANIGIFFLSFLGPGFLLWYVHSPLLFERLDFLKIVVLSIAVSAPTFVVPFLLTALIHRVLLQKENVKIELYGDPVDWYLRHGVGNALNMYTIIFVVWLLELSGRGIVYSILATVMLNIVAEIHLVIRFSKNPEKAYAVWFSRFSGK